MSNNQIKIKIYYSLYGLAKALYSLILFNLIFDSDIWFFSKIFYFIRIPRAQTSKLKSLKIQIMEFKLE